MAVVPSMILHRPARSTPWRVRSRLPTGRMSPRRRKHWSGSSSHTMNRSIPASGSTGSRISPLSSTASPRSYNCPGRRPDLFNLFQSFAPALVQRQFIGPIDLSAFGVWKMFFLSPKDLCFVPRNTIIRLYLEGPRSILRKTFVPITKPDHGYQRVANCQPQPVLAPFVTPCTPWWFLSTVP